MPLRGRFVVRRLGLATTNLYSKYEVFMFTHYKDVKGDEKCKIGVIWGVRGHLRSSETSPWGAYDFLFDFNRNYASILYRFRVIARFSSKVTNFNPPHPIPFEFRRELWCQKTIFKGLSYGVICVILCLVVLIQYLSVTDTHRQTEWQTHDDGIILRLA